MRKSTQGYSKTRGDRAVKVALVSNIFPNPAQRTMGVFTARLLKELKTRVDVTVISPLPWFPKSIAGGIFKRWSQFATVPAEGVFEGVKVYYPKYLLMPKISGAMHPFLVFLSILPVLGRLKRQGQCDIINAHWVYPDGVAACMAGRILKIPVVLTAMGCDINLYGAYRLRAPQIKWALNAAIGITAKSRDLARKIAGFGVSADKITFIPNGIDAGVFNAAACRSRARPDGQSGNQVLYLGRLSSEKGVDTLVDAIALLAAEGEDIRLQIVGEGELNSGLKKKVKVTGLQGRVAFHGPVPHAEVAGYLSGATVVCLPSLREGTPNAALEALACGRPVAASRVGGLPDIIIEGVNGYMFEPGSARGIAEALKKAIKKDWDPSVIAATITHLTWQASAEAYLREYLKAMRVSGTGLSGLNKEEKSGPAYVRDKRHNT